MNSLLLAAYPARLRRRHGAELITTMAEVAGPAGPTRADRRQLVLDGLRERFRLPPGRPAALVAAVLAVLVGGAIGAAAGSWAGMWTYPEVPAPGPVASQAVGADAALEAHPTRQRFWSDAQARLNPGVGITEWSLRPPTYVPLVIGGLALGLVIAGFVAVALAAIIARPARGGQEPVDPQIA